MREQIKRLLEQIKSSSNQTPQSDARRASFRYNWPGHAMVELVDPDTSSEPLFVTVGHLSQDGLEFRSSHELKPGQKVLVTLETDEGQLQIPATVVHSTQSVGRPIIAVKFDLQDSCRADDQ